MKFFINRWTHFVITIIFLYILFFFVIYYFYAPNNNNEKKVYTIDLFNQNTKEIDSLIEQMPLDEKISQLLAFDYQKKIDSILVDTFRNFIRDHQPGMLIYKENNWKNAKRIYTEIQKVTKIKPIRIEISTQNVFFPDFYHIPQSKKIQIASINDSTLLNKIENNNTKYAEKLHISSFITDYFPSFLSKKIPINFDSTILKTTYKKTLNSIQRSLKKNSIPCAKITENFIFNCTDSALNNIRNQYLQFLIDNKVPVFYLQVDSLYVKKRKSTFIEIIRKQKKFDGLLIVNLNKNIKLTPQNLKTVFTSGADILLINDSLPKIKKQLITLIQKKEIEEELLNQKLKKILALKYWVKKTEIVPRPLHQKYDSISAVLLRRSLVEASIILMKNDKNLIPFSLKTNKILQLNFGNTFEHFNKSIKTNTSVLFRNIDQTDTTFNLKFAHGYPTVIACLDIKPDSIAIYRLVNALHEIDKKTNLIIVNFSDIDNISYFEQFTTIVQAHTNSEFVQNSVAQMLQGGENISGQTPCFVGNMIKINQGIYTQKNRLKYDALPEECGIISDSLLKIDSIIHSAINLGVFPGCQIFAARNGKIFFNKSYGQLSYTDRNVRNTDLYDIASLTKATATTIATMKMIDKKKLKLSSKLNECFKNTQIEYTKIDPDTVINIDTMKLSEVENIKHLLKNRDTIHLNDTIIVAFDTVITKLTPSRNIFQVTIEDLLRHESGISAIMPILPYYFYKTNPNRYKFKLKPKRFVKMLDSLNRYGTNMIALARYFQDTTKKSGLKDTIRFNKDSVAITKDSALNLFYKYYCYLPDDSCCDLQIAANFYLKSAYTDTLWIDTKQLTVYSRKFPQYSDVNMILLQNAIDSINQMRIDEFMNEEFFAPLNLKHICYTPTKYFSKSVIAPTEYDRLWREQMVRGYVHDPSAAMLGGISGNAGLFANAHDIGVIYQMLLNGGIYGGKQFLKAQTIKTFTKKQLYLKRGLGFDMGANKTIIAEDASEKSYGHTGFTGTCAWVDPEKNLVFVFLSNRVHPSASNWKINTYKIRQKVHQQIYNAMNDSIL